MDTMGALYEHNTYTDGNNNYDGGQLAGDSMLRGLQSQIQNMMTNVSANSTGLNIYDIGIKIDKEGKMSLDSTKFKETMGALYEHNTYTDGNNNYDGGQLAGDSMLRGLQSQIQNMMTNVSANSSGLNIYDIGIKIDKEGKMSLDSTKFKENIADNFNAVVKIFSSDEKDKNGNKVGILAQLKDTVDSYTKSDGLLKKREDDLNAQIKDYEADLTKNDAYNKVGILAQLKDTVDSYTKSDGLLKKREDDLNAQIKDYEADLTKNDAYIAEYEASLRQKYARLDTTIAGYNQSLNYLVSAMG